jgi:hypothetical protein
MSGTIDASKSKVVMLLEIFQARSLEKPCELPQNVAPGVRDVAMPKANAEYSRQAEAVVTSYSYMDTMTA